MKLTIGRICVIIVVKNRLDELERCLISLRKRLSETDSVYLVDNGSDDQKTLNNLRQEFSQFNWALNSENTGFCGGNHQGSQWALERNYQYLFLLNPDTEILDNTIPELLKASKSLSDQWILGPLLLRNHEGANSVIDSAGLTIDKLYRAVDIHQGKSLSTMDNPKAITPVDGLCGAGIFIPTSLFPLREEKERHSIFEEEFFAYFEDAEFSWYWRNRGGKFGMVNQAQIIHHRGGGSQLKGITREGWLKNRFVIEKMLRNRYLTMARHEKRGKFLKNLPHFIAYELSRLLYMMVRKPWLVRFQLSCWKIIFKKIVNN